MPLPARKITARYGKGILKVTVRVPEHVKAGPRHIAVQQSG
jgi:HSP20 family molecular chaperone IbpA